MYFVSNAMQLKDAVCNIQFDLVDFSYLEFSSQWSLGVVIDIVIIVL